MEPETDDNTKDQQDSTQEVGGMDAQKVGAEGGSRSEAATADRAASLPDDQGAHDSEEFKSLKLGQTAVKKKYYSSCFYIIPGLNFLEANTKTVQNTNGLLLFWPPGACRSYSTNRFIKTLSGNTKERCQANVFSEQQDKIATSEVEAKALHLKF